LSNQSKIIDNQSKIVNGWCFYDWANSVYQLVITATIFPIYYNQVTQQGDNDIVSFFGTEFINTELYAYSISFAFLVVAVISPLLSSMADYTGNKRGFMQFFAYLGAISCMVLFLFDGSNIELGIIAFVMATIGYSGSIVFYNSFLPEIATPEEQDNLSARGYAYGYVGSLILLCFNLSMIMMPEVYGITDSRLPARIAFLTVGLWWIGFSQITFRVLPKNVFNRTGEGNVLLKGYRELGMVLNQLKELKTLKLFLISFFMYSAGVQTVIYMATNFGTKELHIPQEILIFTILIIQIVGVAGAYLFSYLSKLKGNINALAICICIYIGICGSVYFVYEQTGFIIAAAFVGLVMGGVQSLSRSTYSKMLPETQDHASYFSFFDVMEKLAIVIGTASYGYMEAVTGSMRNSIVLLILFFVMGLILLLRIKRSPNAV